MPPSSNENNSKYQYIFLDYKILLKCDAAEIQKFRQSDSGVVIIVMLNPISLDQQINKINEIKLDGYLTKPIKQSDLLHVFSVILKISKSLESVTTSQATFRGLSALTAKRHFR